MAYAEFRCPVCRAKQDLARVCRRCEADLTLVFNARRRLAYLLSQRPNPPILTEIAELAPSLRIEMDRNPEMEPRWPPQLGGWRREERNGE